MISWGTRRKITIVGSVFFALLIVFATLVFVFFRPHPTCNDGMKNQDELGIDCGGACSKVCSVEVSDIVVHWARVFKVSPSVYDAAALLENPNIGFAAKNLRYTLKVYDEKNVLVAERTGVTFVNEKDRFVLFEPRIDVGNRIPVRASLVLEPVVWQRLPAKQGTVVGTELSVSGQRLITTPSLRLTATITNNAGVTIAPVAVSAVVSDEKGNVLGVSSTSIDSIESGQSAPVFFTWPNGFAGTPTSIEILPRIHETF